jgi:hypothetical protein
MIRKKLDDLHQGFVEIRWSLERNQALLEEDVQLTGDLYALRVLPSYDIAIRFLKMIGF